MKDQLEDFNIRCTSEEDIPTILGFIKALAEYERLSHEVVTTEEVLRQYLFEKKFAETVIAEYKGKPVGFALYFHNFSTFVGKAGVYLEDLFVKPEYRGNGFGKALLVHLAKLAKERDCGRFEWSVLDWNDPSIKFYESIGASMMKEWRIMRVSGEALTTLAAM